MSIDNTTQDAALRQLALGRLKKQAEFKLHAMIYVLVNGFLVVIWWMTGVPFFWPVFPMFGWALIVPADFIMSRDMMNGIKSRAKAKNPSLPPTRSQHAPAEVTKDPATQGLQTPSGHPVSS
jgi:hypothetical protein